jgi:hypothetical protein
LTTIILYRSNILDTCLAPALQEAAVSLQRRKTVDKLNHNIAQRPSPDEFEALKVSKQVE